MTESTFTLPPRQPTMLARYSRRSKLVTGALSLTGVVSLLFLLIQILSNQTFIEPAKHHGPRIMGAENQGKFSNSAVNSASTSAAKNQESAVINKQDDHSVPMAEAPDPEVTENTPLGDLPRISEDGRAPWQVYSRPFNGADKRPRLAILITDLGMQRLTTDDAIRRMPTNVTLAFNAQSPAIGAWIARARQEGHEVLLSVPMEPFDFPNSDPGPHTLLTSLPNAANLEKLNWALRQAAGYIGILTMSGSRFLTETEKLRPVMEVLQTRGLMALDTHIAPHSALFDLARDMHVPIAVTNERIGDNLTPEAIDASLQQLVQTARLNGKAVGVLPSLPIVMNRLEEWLKTLPQEGIALAPVSAVTQ